MGSLDEAYLDITEYCSRTSQTPAEAAKALRVRVREKTGGLTCSCGIAPVRFIAKIAADKEKPDGQYIVPPCRGAVAEFMRGLQTRKVGGIGKVTEKTLVALGITTCDQLLPNKLLLYRAFSPTSFVFFVRVALGVDSQNSDAGGSRHRKSLSAERTFSEISGAGPLMAKLEEISASVASQVARAQLPPARTLTLKLKETNFTIVSRCAAQRGHNQHQPTPKNQELLSDRLDNSSYGNPLTSDSVLLAAARRQSVDGGPFAAEDGIRRAAAALLTAEIQLRQRKQQKPLAIRLMGVRLSGFLWPDEAPKSPVPGQGIDKWVTRAPTPEAAATAATMTARGDDGDRTPRRGRQTAALGDGSQSPSLSQSPDHVSTQ